MAQTSDNHFSAAYILLKIVSTYTYLCAIKLSTSVHKKMNNDDSYNGDDGK